MKTIVKHYLIEMPNGRELVVMDPTKYTDATILDVREVEIVIVDLLND
jgi:hypothetical protein